MRAIIIAGLIALVAWTVGVVIMMELERWHLRRFTAKEGKR